MNCIVFKKGGETGFVAINPELVTHVKAVAGPYTDIFFGDTRLAVEGGFRDVVNKLVGEEVVRTPASLNWTQALHKPVS